VGGAGLGAEDARVLERFEELKLPVAAQWRELRSSGLAAVSTA
jgi:hypothetical protein